MRRRTLLSVVAVLVGSGCLDGDADRSTDRASDDRSGGLRIDEIYPREVERAGADYEFIYLENTGEGPVNITGYVVDYGNGNRHTFEELQMEAGSGLYLFTRTGENTTLDLLPPDYQRFADFPGGQNASVMDGTGTVRIAHPDGTVVDSQSYDVDDPPPQREPNV